MVHILVTGASGSGTTTLGRALAARLHREHVDTDDLFWMPTVPPFRVRRDRDERFALLQARLSGARKTVVSGAIEGWGAALEDAFGLIVYLEVSTDIRVARLRHRELARHGRVNEDFLQWAAQYDVGVMPGRSRSRQLAWLEDRRCPVLRLSGEEPTDSLVRAILGPVRVQPAAART